MIIFMSTPVNLPPVAVVLSTRASRLVRHGRKLVYKARSHTTTKLLASNYFQLAWRSAVYPSQSN